ncbi:MAG TPA: ABC transporter, partial [Phenylobacterium sp.]
MRLIRPLLAAAAALALSGCISLLPKTDPAQLYRFGAVPQAAGAASSSGQIGILKPRSGFTQAAAGDRILTVTNGQAAYIAAARWVAPASVLFEEAVANAYDSNPGAARLVTRGEVARADLVMR